MVQIKYASTSQVLSQGATDQASTVEELSASIEEINDQVQNTANKADNTNELQWISLKVWKIVILK